MSDTQTTAAIQGLTGAGGDPLHSAIKPQEPAAKPMPVQLQFNQSGAWRGAVIFDLKDAPAEMLIAADTLARLSGSTARLVVCRPGENGRDVPTRMVVRTWTRAKGWS